MRFKDQHDIYTNQTQTKKRLFRLWNKEHLKPQAFPSHFWKTRYSVDSKVISNSDSSCTQLHRYIASTLIPISPWNTTLKPCFMQSPIVSGHSDYHKVKLIIQRWSLFRTGKIFRLQRSTSFNYGEDFGYCRWSWLDLPAGSIQNHCFEDSWCGLEGYCECQSWRAPREKCGSDSAH